MALGATTKNRSWTISKNTKQMVMSTWWQRQVQGKQLLESN